MEGEGWSVEGGGCVGVGVGMGVLAWVCWSNG